MLEPKVDIDEISDNEISISYETSSVSSTTEEESVYEVPLSQTKRRNLFLTKVSIYFMIYTSIAVFSMIFVETQTVYAKYFYRYLRLELYVIYYLITSIALKILMGFFSRYTKFVNYLIFGIDCLLLPVIAIGYWYIFENSQRQYYISKGYWVIVISVSSFALAVGFCLSTLIPHKKMKYNLYFAFPIMFIFSLVTIKLVDKLWLYSEMKW